MFAPLPLDLHTAGSGCAVQGKQEKGEEINAANCENTFFKRDDWFHTDLAWTSNIKTFSLTGHVSFFLIYMFNTL